MKSPDRSFRFSLIGNYRLKYAYGQARSPKQASRENAEKGLFAVKIWPQSAKPIRQVAHNIVAKKKKRRRIM